MGQKRPTRQQVKPRNLWVQRTNNHYSNKIMNLRRTITMLFQVQLKIIKAMRTSHLTDIQILAPLDIAVVAVTLKTLCTSSLMN